MNYNYTPLSPAPEPKDRTKTMRYSTWLSTPLDMMLRWNFGERYLGWGRICSTLVFQRICIFFWHGDRGLWLLFWATLLLGLVHRWVIRQRNVKGIPYHSMSNGTSHFERYIHLKEWHLFRFLEPGLCIVVAWLIRHIYHGPLGFFFYVGSISLLIRNNLVFGLQRSKLLDLIDIRIETDYLEAALSGAHKSETAGFTVASVNPMELSSISPPSPPVASTVWETIGYPVASRPTAAEQPQELPSEITPYYDPFGDVSPDTEPAMG